MSTPIERFPITIVPQDAKEALEKFGIRLGAPLAFPGAYFISVPSTPHIFLCQELNLEENGKLVKTAKEALVMIGHGVAFSTHERSWRFQGTRKRVSDTVETYNHISSQLHWPILDCLLVCRETPPPIDKVTVVITRRYPFIFADSTVVIRDTEEPGSNWIFPGRGVGSLTADARCWQSIDWWEKHWWHPEMRTVRPIPDWSKYPCIPS